MSTGFLEPKHLELKKVARQAFEKVEPLEDDQALKTTVARLGFYKFLVPERDGGALPKVDARSICVIREELAYKDAAADSVFAVQGLGSHPIVLSGNAEQRALLKGVVDGSHLFAFALTEESAGSDVAALKTEAKKAPHDFSQDEGFVLNGSKRFISNAGIATHYTVFARTAPGPKGISAFIVPAKTPGLGVKPMSLIGKHPIGELTFQSCQVPASALIGAEGDGMRLALGTLDMFRATVGAAAVGMGRRAQDEAIVYAKKREQFGAPLATLQGVQFMLAENAVDLDAARLLVHRAAAAKDSGQERITYEAGVGKLFATEAAQRVIDRSLQIHGGNGLVAGAVVERLYRDVRALRIYEGASEVQKVVIARQVLA